MLIDYITYCPNGIGQHNNSTTLLRVVKPFCATIVNMRLAVILAILAAPVAALPAYAASLTVYAPQMTIGRSDGVVVLTFPKGLSAISGGEYRVSAGYGRITVSSAGFAPLEQPDKVESDSEGTKLPKLPRARFSTKNVRSMRFSGRAVLRSEEYEASMGSLASSDGGRTWTLSGNVKFRALNKAERTVRGERFVFSRDEMVLRTEDAIEITEPESAAGGASLRSQDTVIDLQEQRATLAGDAEFSFGDYALRSDRMTLDLAERKLTAEGSPRFVGEGSEVTAKEVVVFFADDEVTVEATELSGYLTLRSQAGGA